MKKISVLFLVLSAVLGGCYYDNYMELYPAGTAPTSCDTVSPVTYTNQVAAVMNGYCISCHSGSIPNGGIKLDTYDGTKSAAASGKMVPALRGTGPKPMPPNTRLDECSIREVELWIQNGYAQ